MWQPALIRKVYGPDTLRLLLAGLLLVSALPLFAQQKISLRFIDYESGKAISNIDILSIWWNGSSLVTAPQNQTVVSKVSAKTKGDGMITIPVPASIPEHLDISSLDTINPVSVDLPVLEILKTGVVVPYSKNGPNPRPSPTPEEVLVITRKLTARERVAREFP
jgi:hypothetical protein